MKRRRLPSHSPSKQRLKHESSCQRHLGSRPSQSPHHLQSVPCLSRPQFSLPTKEVRPREPSLETPPSAFVEDIVLFWAFWALASWLRGPTLSVHHADLSGSHPTPPYIWMEFTSKATPLLGCDQDSSCVRGGPGVGCTAGARTPGSSHSSGSFSRSLGR